MAPSRNPHQDILLQLHLNDFEDPFWDGKVRRFNFGIFGTFGGIKLENSFTRFATGTSTKTTAYLPHHLALIMGEIQGLRYSGGGFSSINVDDFIRALEGIRQKVCKEVIGRECPKNRHPDVHALYTTPITRELFKAILDAPEAAEVPVAKPS